MAVSINNAECIGCNLCVPVCPNRAIREINDPAKGPQWQVDHDLCTECVAFYGAPRCMEECPPGDDCITFDPKEDEELLRARAVQLGDYRESLGLPRNYAYAENQDLEPAPGLYGPKPGFPQGEN